MAINKIMRATLKALSYPDPDIKKAYKVVRNIEKTKQKHFAVPKNCQIVDLSILRNDFPIPVRIFSSEKENPKGTILFFHGGGWVKGNIDTYTNVCASMAMKLSRTVVSVDYRRAPEYKFPNATEDCYQVAKELFDGTLLPNISIDNIVILGDSAGGNIAAAVSLMARDRGEFSPKSQILLYPSTGNDHGVLSPFDSVIDNGFDYLLTSKRVMGYMELYISDKSDLENPYLAPLLAKDLTNQPDTFIITAEYCPLRDEGEAYGTKLLEAGNKVSIYRMADALHGYFLLPYHFKHVKKTYELIKDFLAYDTNGGM